MPTFLTPLAGLVALAALVPPAAAWLRERRARRVRRVLGLAAPGRLRAFAPAAAAAAGIGLLGLAAAQPAVATTQGVRARTDAQGYLVLDNSRSMLAVSTRGGPSRFRRAQELALRLRDAVPALPWGVASFNDRTLVHAFPTPDRQVVADTLDQSIGIERPSPVFQEQTATAFDTLAETARANFFRRAAEKRVLVLFTDGESRRFSDRMLALALRSAHIHVVLVRLWSAQDRVYGAHGQDLGYRPDPTSAIRLRQLATLEPFTVVDERDAGRLPGLVRRLIGTGPSAAPRGERHLTPLAPAVVVAAFAPLGLALFLGRR